MTTIQRLWQTVETQYNNGTFPDDSLEKIDEMIYNEDIAYIKQGVVLVLDIAPEYLCRYLELDGESVVLREKARFSAPPSAERVLVETAKSESMWQALYENGAFGLMEHNIFVALGDVTIENLSESDKAFCVRMAKEMVRVPAGEFMMGALVDDGDAYDSEKPRHKVTLTRDFLMGKYLVTQALWDSVMDSNPSYFDFKGANRPVEQVSWFDVVEFCNKLSEKEGLEPAYIINGQEVTCNWSANGYRLPTEAEWEYSARGGEYHKYSGSDNVDEVAWYDDNSRDETHPVGLKRSNGVGLYDMSGNVWEWVWDVWGDYSSVSQTDPKGPDRGLYRVYRGGGWGNSFRFACVSVRWSNSTSRRSDVLGFRLVRTSPN